MQTKILMIMRKLIFVLSLILPILFVSCSDSKKSPLTGTWIQDEKYIHLHDGELLIVKNISFKPDGYGMEWNTFPGNEDIEVDEGNDFKWESDDNQIKIYEKSGMYVVDYAILDGQLILYSDGDRMIFNKCNDANCETK